MHNPMKNRWRQISIIGAAAAASACTLDSDSNAQTTTEAITLRVATPGGGTRNMFAEIGRRQAEIDAKVDAIWDNLIATGIINDAGDDMAYVYAGDSQDVRSEGMSYGMMLAVQLDREQDFQRLWRWAQTYMYNDSGRFEGYYAWQCDSSGNKLDEGPAPDGELYFAAALFMADIRWGSKADIFDYRTEANTLLEHMHTTIGSEGVNIFDNESKLILFVPQAPGGLATDGTWLTDPSYMVPTFLRLFGDQADSNNEFWYEAETAAREFLHTTTHAVTGLAPEYATFDGVGANADWSVGKEDFRYDAHRVIGNIGMDYAWLGVDQQWQYEQVSKQLGFFWDEGIDAYLDTYTLEGGDPGGDRYRANSLIAMNAVGCLVADIAADEFHCHSFVERLWDLDYPNEIWGYYGNLLHAFADLHAAGEYQIYGLEAGSDDGGSDDGGSDDTTGEDTAADDMAADDTAGDDTPGEDDTMGEDDAPGGDGLPGDDGDSDGNAGTGTGGGVDTAGQDPGSQGGGGCRVVGTDAGDGVGLFALLVALGLTTRRRWS